MIQVSQPYVAIGIILEFNNLSFVDNEIFLVTQTEFIFTRTAMACAKRDLISTELELSLVIFTPKYLNKATCSIVSPSIFISSFDCLLATSIHFVFSLLISIPNLLLDPFISSNIF